MTHKTGTVQNVAFKLLSRYYVECRMAGDVEVMEAVGLGFRPQ
jgi:hypothetical protein